MSRIGIIKSIDNEKKEIQLIGFGECVGSSLVENEDIGIEVEVPSFKLDSGTEMNNTYGYYWAEENVIKSDLENYEDKGYTINNLSV